MAKPPQSPPHSDIDGVHQDGTRPGKKLPGGEAGEALELAAREDAGRPDHSDDRPADDRSA
jgi:hypothetical protein